MYRQFDVEDFYAFKNDHVEFCKWFTSPELKTNHKVNVGIDQSSTRTGICVISPDLLYIAELPRGFMSVTEYKKALIIELRKILKGLEIDHFIYEKHGNHITPLHSMINEITDELKRYTKNFLADDVKIVGILPTVWRKGFLPKSEYSGNYKRELVKEASATEAIKIYPKLQLFKNYSGKDLDGFEALGIILGYLRLNYDKDGNRVVNSSMEFKNGRRYKYRLQKTNRHDLDSDIKLLRNGRKIPLLKSNIELLFDNSLNRVVGEFSKAIIEYSEEHSEICRFIFELEEPHMPGDIYLALVESL